MIISSAECAVTKEEEEAEEEKGQITAKDFRSAIQWHAVLFTLNVSNHSQWYLVLFSSVTKKGKGKKKKKKEKDEIQPGISGVPASTRIENGWE